MTEQSPTVSPQPDARIPDLHAGQTWVSDDFDAPLPDSFWLGEECLSDNTRYTDVENYVNAVLPAVSPRPRRPRS